MHLRIWAWLGKLQGKINTCGCVGPKLEATIGQLWLVPAKFAPRTWVTIGEYRPTSARLLPMLAQTSARLRPMLAQIRLIVGGVCADSSPVLVKSPNDLAEGGTTLSTSGTSRSSSDSSNVVQLRARFGIGSNPVLNSHDLARARGRFGQILGTSCGVWQGRE